VKIIPSILLAAATLALGSCATSNQAGGGGGETALGPHSAQKVAMGRFRAGEVASDMRDHAVALVLRVDCTMEGGKQVIKANATHHLDGPNGPAEAVDNISVRVTQPAEAHAEGHKVAGATSTSSVPVPNGKYKTVVAEAMLSSSKVPDLKVSVTVPGDQ
jgi:hypothetical protein